MDPHFTLEPDAVRVTRVADKSAALRFLSEICAETYGLDAKEVEACLLEREELGSTGFGRGVAIPHARLGQVNRPVAALLKLSSPVAFDAADGMPVELAFGLISPENAGAAHLHALAAISRMVREETTHRILMEATDAETLRASLANANDRDVA